MFAFLLETASTVAHAANAQAAQWDVMTIRDFAIAIIGAIFAGYIAVQNARIKKHAETIISQNISHEQNAQARAAGRVSSP